MSVDNKGVEDQLLKRIDDMIEEMHIIRRKVAELLVAQADSEARASSCEASIMSLEELYQMDFGKKNEPAKESEEVEFIPPEGFDKEPIKISDLPNEESEANHHEVEEVKSSEATPSESDTFNELFHRTEPQEAMNEIFMPLNSESAMDTIFEKQLSLDHLLDRFSLADRYLYANELFGGDQVAFDEALTDVEKFSSWTQVESYFYDVLRLKKDNSVVKDFMSIIKESSK